MSIDLSVGLKDEARLVTAVHEAGHVWAYYRHDRCIRYVTVRPRRTDYLGRVVVRPRRISEDLRAWIAAAGPVAEATYLRNRVRESGRWDREEWDDVLLGALFGAGREDYDLVPSYLDEMWWYGLIRELQDRDWSKICRLAHALTASKTLSGPDAFDLLR